jgi:hypothetical protein
VQVVNRQDVNAIDKRPPASRHRHRLRQSFALKKPNGENPGSMNIDVRSAIEASWGLGT